MGPSFSEINQDSVEKFLNNETDLYIYLSQVEGVVSPLFDNTFITKVSVTGYCKLTDEHRRPDIFADAPGMIIISAYKLEIFARDSVYPKAWSTNKKDNFFRPLVYYDKDAVLNKRYALHPVKDEFGVTCYSYAITQKMLFIEDEEILND